MLAAAIFFVIAVPALGATGEFGRMSARGRRAALGAGAAGQRHRRNALRPSRSPLFGLSRTFTITTGGLRRGRVRLRRHLLGRRRHDRHRDRPPSSCSPALYLVANYGRPGEAISVDDAAAIIRRDAIAAEPPRRAWRHFCDQHRFAIGLSLAIFLGVLFGAASVLLRYAAEGFDAAAAASVRIPVVLPFVFTVALVQPRSSLRRWSIPRRSLPWILLSGAVGDRAAGGARHAVPPAHQRRRVHGFLLRLPVDRHGLRWPSSWESASRAGLWLGALIVIGGIAIMALA